MNTARGLLVSSSLLFTVFDVGMRMTLASGLLSVCPPSEEIERYKKEADRKLRMENRAAAPGGGASSRTAGKSKSRRER